jgi:hypothetical protein
MSTPSGSGEADGDAPAASTYYDIYGPDVRALLPSFFLSLLGGKLRFHCFRVVELGKTLITCSCVSLLLGKTVFFVFDLLLFEKNCSF